MSSTSWKFRCAFQAASHDLKFESRHQNVFDKLKTQIQFQSRQLSFSLRQCALRRVGLSWLYYNYLDVERKHQVDRWLGARSWLGLGRRLWARCRRTRSLFCFWYFGVASFSRYASARCVTSIPLDAIWMWRGSIRVDRWLGARSWLGLDRRLWARCRRTRSLSCFWYFGVESEQRFWTREVWLLKAYFMQQ